jgi:hypothetical protein
VSFGVPSEPESNWVFRMTAGPDVDPRAIVKRAMACFAAPLIICSSLLFAVIIGAGFAAFHLIYASLTTAVLIEALTADFRVLPFTCLWLPGPKNPAVAAAAWFGGLLFYGQMAGGIENFLRQNPTSMPVVLVFVAGVFVFLRRAHSANESVVWTDTRGELELLKITD